MKKSINNSTWIFCIIACAMFTTSSLFAQVYDTEEIPMMRGVSNNFKSGWQTDALFTVGEAGADGSDYSEDRFNYRPLGVLDGMYAFKKSYGSIQLLVNHELSSSRGYPYTLANGTTLTGARITSFAVKQDFVSGNVGVQSAKLAYTTIYDRYFAEVVDPAQINGGSNPGSLDGLNRLCSANGIERNKFGFKSDIFFSGEETGGGQEFILDVKNEVLYCAPAMGRAAWESVTVMDNLDSDKVVVLIGDDRSGAPLILYIGEKNDSFSNDAPQFLKKNGLAKGHLFVWVATNGELSPEDWNGTGTSRSGSFVKIEHYNPSMAGMSGWDNVGYADQSTQDAMAAAVDNFQFSRPEDVETNPEDGTQAVIASTGRSSSFPSDTWGTTYLLDIENIALYNALNGPLEAINNIPADLKILYDGDDAGNGQVAGPDYGLRSPDNLTWGEDGYIYVNEDRSVGGFCSESGFEASVWQLNPNDGQLKRILQMDRSAVPFMQTDSNPNDCGNWESSGTIDVTRFFRTKQNETLLLLNVQAHSNDNSTNPNSPIGGDDDLSEGGQIFFASKLVESIARGQENTNYRVLEQNKAQNNSQFSVLVYPNPANELLNLSKETAYQLYDVLGTLVLEGTPTREINVSQINPGVYFLKMAGETQKVIIK